MNFDDPIKPTASERLMNAFASSDLSIKAGARKDADYLIALGLAQQHGRQVSGSLMRLSLAGNQADYRAAREGVVALTKRMNAERNWRLSGPSMRHVGELALAHHVFPTCPACNGRKWETPQGAPALSGVACKACHGTGDRPIQRRHNNHIRDVIEVLKSIDLVTARTVARLVR